MTEFFRELPPEYLAAYERFMELRDGNGHVLVDAEERVTEILKELVTLEGKLEESTAKRLGGQPAKGRQELILPLLHALQGLIGFEPLLGAWMAALVGGNGFDAVKPSLYRARVITRDGEPKVGPPGTLLPRYLAQHRDDRQSGRANEVMSRAQHAELGAMILALIVKALQDATCARLALGPAWVVGKAVYHLSDAIQRRIDALAGNEEAVAAIGDAVAEVVARFEPIAVRTNEQVRTSLPIGEDAGRYFKERQAAMENAAMEKAIERLTVAVEQRLQPEGEQGEMDDSLASAADRVIAVVQAKSGGHSPDDVATLVAAATRYLDEPAVLTPDEEQVHRERLAILMPSLSIARPLEAQLGSALLTVSFFHLGGRAEPLHLTGDDVSDGVVVGILDRIRHHVIEVGLPPANTPVTHLIFFELIANALFTCIEGPHAERPHPEWIEAGLTQAKAIGLDPIVEDVSYMMFSGLVGLEPDRFRRRIGERAAKM